MTAQQIAVTVGFIFIIDRPLDMLRTSINIAGDLAVSTAVATWKGSLTVKYSIGAEFLTGTDQFGAMSVRAVVRSA